MATIIHLVRSKASDIVTHLQDCADEQLLCRICQYGKGFSTFCVVERTTDATSNIPEWSYILALALGIDYHVSILWWKLSYIQPLC